MTIFINPGSGPVAGAIEAEARKNVDALCADLRERGHAAEVSENTTWRDDGEGRWETMIVVDGIGVDVDMPGLPLAQVRWMNEPEQNIWDFPRLYVDGSSWVWLYALDACCPDNEDDA